jgi:K+-transporting ATPase ATPase C chain
MLIFFTILLGLVYPAFVTLIGKVFFSYQVNGSLIYKDQQIIGSELIGQEFTDPKYFWGRPSATTPVPYNAAASIGSNFGPLNPDLYLRVKNRLEYLKKNNPAADSNAPIDLVNSSGSGLDPHISANSAFYQLKRIAKIRKIDYNTLHHLVYEQSPNSLFSKFSPRIINVLQLNLALDALEASEGNE